MKLFCIDVGYSATKFCLYENDIRMIPSFVKEAGEDNGKNVVEVDDKRFICGEAARQSKHSTFSLGPRAEDQNTYVLIQAAMGQLLKPDDEIYIVTGLPDKEQPIFKDEYIRRLSEIGNFVYNGQGYNIKFAGIKVHKQSKGMFFSQYFTPTTEENLEMSDLMIGIAEMGWRTMHLSQIIEMQFMDDFSETFELGMYNVCKDLAKLIYSKYKLTLNPEQLAPCLHTRTLPLYGQYEDINELIDRCYRDHVEKIMKNIGNLWPNLSNLDVVLFGSGGMQPLYEPYFLQMPQFAHNSHLLDRYAVLRGYYRSGLYELGGEVENVEQRDTHVSEVLFDWEGRSSEGMVE